MQTENEHIERLNLLYNRVFYFHVWIMLCSQRMYSIVHTIHFILTTAVALNVVIHTDLQYKQCIRISGVPIKIGPYWEVISVKYELISIKVWQYVYILLSFQLVNKILQRSIAKRVCCMIFNISGQKSRYAIILI